MKEWILLIAYLKGKLTFIQEESIIVDVGGVGYEVLCPNPFIFQSSLEKELFIHTYHHVRDDLQQLFGFKDDDEKYLFTKLISVSGIGPKSAIGILGNAQVNEFIAAVETEDEKYLTQFPGVGKKTARQIILDLKGKLTSQMTIEDTPGPTESNHLMINEVKEALKSLGYAERELTQVLQQLQKDNITETDEAIRKALVLLAT